MTDFEIRRAKLDDLSFLKEFAAIGDAHTPYLNENTYVATVEESGIIVGFVSAFLLNINADHSDDVEKELEITELLVNRSFRKQGIGSKLLDQVLQTDGVSLFTVTIPEHRDIAIRLFESRGCTIVKKIASLFDCHVDGILMHKTKS